MCIRDRPEPWIPLPANGSQNHHHIPPAAGERETCTHATASTTGGPHVPRSAGPFPSPKCFLCPLCPITEPAGGPANCYDSDLPDAAYAVIEPILNSRPKIKSGRPMEYPWLEILNTIFYLLRTGCQWRNLPHDLVKWWVAYRWFRTLTKTAPGESSTTNCTGPCAGSKDAPTSRPPARWTPNPCNQPKAAKGSASTNSNTAADANATWSWTPSDSLAPEPLPPPPSATGPPAATS